MRFDSRVIKYTKFDSSNKMIFDLSHSSADNSTCRSFMLANVAKDSKST